MFGSAVVILSYTIESGLDILRSLGDEWWIISSFLIQPQIHTEVFDIVSSISAGNVIALYVKVQSYPAGLHFQTAYIHLHQAGFPVSWGSSVVQDVSTV